MSNVTINLTREQAEYLHEVLSDRQDEGPLGYGWKSAELDRLVAIVGDAIDEQGEKE